MPNKNAPRLPPELLREILKDLSKKDLLSTALISRNFRDASQELLFHTGPMTQDELIHFLFLKSIYLAPGLARFVRIYLQHDLWVASFLLRPTTTLMYPDMSRMRSTFTQKLVPLMVNLKRFEYTKTGMQFNPDLRFISQSSFNLETFRWGTRSEDELYLIIEKFLPTQKRLKHLSLWIKHTFYTKNASRFHAALDGACPHLESLSGMRGTMELFLPGRKIKCIQWSTHNSDRCGQSVEHLAQYLRVVESISWGGKYRPKLFTLVAPHLKSVKILHMTSVNVNIFPQTMANFPHLESLIMCLDPLPQPRGAPMIQPEPIYNNTLRGLHNLNIALHGCTKLREIYVEYGDTNHRIIRLDATENPMRKTYSDSLPRAQTLSPQCILWDQDSHDQPSLAYGLDYPIAHEA